MRKWSGVLRVLIIIVLSSFIATLFLSQILPQKTEVLQAKRPPIANTNPITELPGEQKPESDTPENKAARELEYALKEFGDRNELNLKNYKYVAVANLHFETQKNVVYYLYWFSNIKVKIQKENELTLLASTFPNVLIRHQVVSEITELYTTRHFQHDMGLNISTFKVKTDVLSWIVILDLKEKAKAERIL